MKPDAQGRLNLSDQGNPPFPGLANIKSFGVTAYFAVTGRMTVISWCNCVLCSNRPHDSNIKRLYVMCSVRWKSGTEYFAKMRGTKANRKHIYHLAIANTFKDNTDKFLYL
jgi:hypothetical protein